MIDIWSGMMFNLDLIRKSPIFYKWEMNYSNEYDIIAFIKKYYAIIKI